MTVDLTGVAVAATSGFFSVLAIIITVWLQNHISNKAAAETLSNAVKNSLGAIQQAATSQIQQAHPQIPNVPASLAPGVQYVLDHAGDEMAKLGITPQSVASKIEAQVGLANIQNNIAVSSNATPVVLEPMAPSPVPAV
jgi:hypothetical protein